MSDVSLEEAMAQIRDLPGMSVADADFLCAVLVALHKERLLTKAIEIADVALGRPTEQQKEGPTNGR